MCSLPRPAPILHASIRRFCLRAITRLDTSRCSSGNKYVEAAGIVGPLGVFRSSGELPDLSIPEDSLCSKIPVGMICHCGPAHWRPKGANVPKVTVLGVQMARPQAKQKDTDEASCTRANKSSSRIQLSGVCLSWVMEETGSPTRLQNWSLLNGTGEWFVMIHLGQKPQVVATKTFPKPKRNQSIRLITRENRGKTEQRRFYTPWSQQTKCALFHARLEPGTNGRLLWPTPLEVKGWSIPTLVQGYHYIQRF